MVSPYWVPTASTCNENRESTPIWLKLWEMLNAKNQSSWQREICHLCLQVKAWRLKMNVLLQRHCRIVTKLASYNLETLHDSPSSAVIQNMLERLWRDRRCFNCLNADSPRPNRFIRAYLIVYIYTYINLYPILHSDSRWTWESLCIFK